MLDVFLKFKQLKEFIHFLISLSINQTAKLISEKAIRDLVLIRDPNYCSLYL
jgi:hypothetical protein